MIDRFTLEVIDEAGAMARTFAFTGGGRTPVYIIPTNIPGEGDFFMIQLLKNGLCLDDAGGEPSLYFGDCNSNKRNRVFVYNQGLIRSAFTRSHCIDAGGSNLVLKTCVSGNVNQVWSLKSTPSGMAVELQGRPDTCFEANTGNGARIGKCSIADGNQRFKFLVEVCTVRNCALCAVGSSAECATCLDGFTLSNGQCPPKACPLANCATCQNGSTSVCKTCDAGYINAEGTCGLSELHVFITNSMAEGGRLKDSLVACSCHCWLEG
ncbi:MAG: hypothetical protein J3K34DRAFT_40804 [Monoraphidium minutum]|nr:MAG: hypothetical protein J3K34DRAFT_40804 [Monoraphidium minutum]